jgi:dTDP-4-dehydrorhamnose reductase
MAGLVQEPVLIVGANGMLAKAFAALLGRERIAFSSVDVPQIDLTDAASIERNVGAQFRLVLNCAAWTDVDGAEAREADATAVNGSGVGALAARCKQTGATLVHFSTDYVFDGQAKTPYPVDQARAPIGAYGRGKAVGEELLERSGARYLLVRTSWLYAPWGKNFVLTIRDLVSKRDVLSVVADQFGRPTSAEYLAERTLGLLAHGCTGTFHVTDGGECSWHAFASEIARIIGSHCDVQPCTTAEFPRPAKRPAYSVLDLSRTEAVLGASRPWQENLAAVLRQVAKAG